MKIGNHPYTIDDHPGGGAQLTLTTIIKFSTFYMVKNACKLSALVCKPIIKPFIALKKEMCFGSNVF